MVEITASAQDYLVELLSKQEGDDVGIRIFVSDPGTPMAETCIAYCQSGEEMANDEQVQYEKFICWIDDRSKKYLEDALVDYTTDRMGGQLTIKAPNSKVPQVSEDSPLEDRINYVLFSQINPSLASHGGMVNLVEIVDEEIAVLQFGGGCQGCGMVDTTLKDGVEKTLLEQLPQLKAVRDVTDHSLTENAYF
ncbi:MAG: Fe/S biogenesis protein NfuA [Gammaproteobacteria bacterium]|jgi:Fe/S biogenesis protein NfuA|nr:Fe/S biogenesis protein NfuA [Gammaproteobacteria bacterium]